MKKKILSFVIIICTILCIFSALSITASAASSGSCGKNLTWTLAGTTLTISGEGSMTNYTDGSGNKTPPWQEYKSKITELIIGEGVTTIGSCAFYYCDSLTSVTIPENVTSIGSWAFNQCHMLSKIYWNAKNVTSIGTYAFLSVGEKAPEAEVIFGSGVRIPSRCIEGASIKNVVLSDDVAYISPKAFVGTEYYTEYYNDISNWVDGVLYINNHLIITDESKESFKSYEIRNGTKTIAGDAFKGCSNLISITIPDGVTSICDGAFNGCSSLTSVSIPDSVKNIGEYAFYDCSSLTSVTIPDSVTNIGGYAFEGSNSFENVVIGDGVTSLIGFSFRGNTNLKKVVIGDGVTSIGWYAFEGCSSLTSVHIGDSVTSIGYYVFSGCGSLTSVSIGDAVKSIDNYAFKGCSSLTSVTIPDSVTNIAGYAFEGCNGLENVVIGDGVTSLNGFSFSGNTNLKKVVIGDRVTSIGYKAFSGCSSLTSINIPDSVTSIGGDAFYYCSNLKEVYISDLTAWCNIDFEQGDSNPIYDGADLYLNNELLTVLEIPDGVVEIKNYAFYGCSNLTSVSIGDSVTSIGDYAFRDCSSLTSISIPDSVTNIGRYAFNGCSSLTSVSIPDSVTSIGSSAFGGCSSLENIVIGNGVTSLAGFYFKNYTNLKKVVIGDGVTSIGDEAFEYCRNLTSVSIGDGVTSIGSTAFYGCSSLTSVNIPDSVISIGSSAFAGCSNLTSVSIGDSVTSIGSSAFENCSNLTSVSIGDGVTSIGDEAFEYCRSLTSVSIPDSVTSIGGSAFYGCSSLTSVSVGDSVTSIGGCAFSYCRSLTSVSIPVSVMSIGDSAFSDCYSLTDVYYYGTEDDRKEIDIGSGNGRLTNATWHYIDEIEPTSISLFGGNEVAVDKTIRLTKTVLPTNATNKSVTWSTSNSSVATVSGGVVKGIGKGVATITATTCNGLTASRMVTVTEEGLTITVYGVKKGLSYETYLLSGAKVIIEDGNTNHQRTSNQNGEASFTKSDIESKIVKVSASCEDYVDYEGGIIFPDSTDSYSVYLKEKDDDIHFTNASIAINGKVKDLLNASSKVYVPYFTKSAINNKKAYQLIIDVDWGILDEGEIKLKGTKNGKEITIAEGSNLIAFASEFEIGEGYKLTAKTKDKDGKEVTKTISLPLEVKVSDLSLGVPSTEVVKMDSGLYFLSDLKMGLSFGELVGADAEITLNKDTATVKLGASKNESVPAGIFDGVGPNVKVGGTVTIPITENGEYGGGLYVSTGGKAKIFDYTHNLIINGVPLYINTEFSGGLNGKLSLSGKNNAVTYTGKLEGAATGEISGGLGGEFTDNLAMKAGVGGGVELKLPAEYKASTAGETHITFDPSLTGYFFLEAEIKAFLLEFEEQLKTGEIKWSKDGLEFGSMLFELNDAEWKPAGRDYLKNGGGFTGDSIALMELSEGRAIDVIYENIISVADAYITNISGKPVLILTVDDKERDDANCLSIAYSAYDNGSWSEPVVIENDGTLDTGVSASGKFVAWEDNNSQVSTMEQMLKTSDISVGVWNGESYEVTSLTNDNVYDFGVKVKEFGNKAIVAWLSNTQNDFTGTKGVTSVNYALYDNGWSEVNAIDNVGKVTNVNVLFDESGYSVVYKNGTTLCTVKNGSTEETIKNIGRYGIESTEGKTVVAYFDEEKALHITENGVEKLSFETDYVSGENPVVENCNGKVYVFWAENDGIYYASNSEGEWCGRRCVVETDKTIESLSCTMVDEQNYTLSYFETDGKTQNLVVFNATEGADLTVADAVYDEEAYANDDNFDYTVSIFNNGEIAAKGGEVKIYENGECVYVTVFDNEIAPGETFEFSGTFCPENGRIKHEYVIEATTAGDYNSKNNTFTVSVGYSDVEVYDAYFVKNYDSSEKLEVCVKNAGTVTMENVEVNVYSDLEEPIYTETVESLAGGAVYLLELEEAQKKNVDYRVEIVAENDENVYNNTYLIEYNREIKALESMFDFETKTLTYEIVKGDEEGATVLIAVYNQDGAQKSVVTQTITYSDYEGEIITVEKPLSDVTGTDSIKVFLWNSVGEMKPAATANEIG